jgi:hypothetical protein
MTIGPNIGIKLGGGSFDPEKRTVTLKFKTSEIVPRYDFWKDEEYDLELLVTKDAVDLTRLDSGHMPVLHAHRSDSLEHVLGYVVAGSFAVVDGAATCVMRFVDPEVNPLAKLAMSHLADDFNLPLSVGALVLEQETLEGANKRKLVRVTKWQPYEISGVPVGADSQAQTLAPQVPPAPRPEQPTQEQQQENKMTEQELMAKGAEAERERQTQIRQAAKTLNLAAEGERLCASGATLEAANKELFRLADEREAATSQQTNIQMGKDHGDKVGELMVEHLVSRMTAKPVPETHKEAEQFRGMTVTELARECLSNRGISTRGRSKAEVIQAAMRMGARDGAEVKLGAHSSGDFPNVLGSAMGRVLMAAYRGTEVSYPRWARRAANFSDLRTRKPIVFGEAPELKALQPGQPYSLGTIKEGAEEMAMVKRGRMLSITEEALINDNLDAFGRVAQSFGREGRRTENIIMCGLLKNNATMSDGITLFHADHGNLAGTAAAPDATSIDLLIQQLELQTFDSRVIGQRAGTILAGTRLRLKIGQVLGRQYQPNTASNVVPGYIADLQDVYDTELDAALASAKPWYLIANPETGNAPEYAYLDGQEGLSVSQESAFEVDELRIKAKLYFAAGIPDWRAVAKNEGVV